jgi:hypothetical protein
MTLPAVPIVNSFTGNSVANSFSFSFPVFSQGDVVVTVISPANVTTILQLGIDYTVNGLNPSGAPPIAGSITLVNSGQAWLTAGALTTAWTITITRTVSVAQLTSIRNQGPYYQETIEAALDYITMICQQLQQSITAPVIPSSLTTVTGDITITTGGSGVIFTDQQTGKQYRIMVQNGILGLQPLP